MYVGGSNEYYIQETFRPETVIFNCVNAAVAVQLIYILLIFYYVHQHPTFT